MGNIKQVIGGKGSITEGLLLDYSYQTEADNQPDILSATTGEVLWKSQDDKVRAVLKQTETYRIITSSFIFGALEDDNWDPRKEPNGSDNTRKVVLTRYMNFLLGNPTHIAAKQNPKQFYLDQNYPNPFNPETTLCFSIPESGMTYLKIYDIRGRIVADLVSEILESGLHEIHWNADHLPSGVYICRLQYATSVETKKLILEK